MGKETCILKAGNVLSACAIAKGILGMEPLQAGCVGGTARSFLGLGICLGPGWQGVSKYH